MLKLFASFGILIFLAPTALADNWSHWRGPLGNGVSLDAQPPTNFSESDSVAWKVPVPGRGSGSPVVWDDRVFVVTATQASDAVRGKLAFDTLCFDRATGQQRWRKTAVEAMPHQDTHATNGHASASPCTDGVYVYSHFGSRGLYCYSIDGDLVWKRDDFGKMNTRNSFGEGSSPALADELIIVPWDHEGPSFLYALDKSTGKTVWKVARDEPTCWATPLIVSNQGRKQVVMKD
jgi:outer membrane protein assembly factor BamB